MIKFDSFSEFIAMGGYGFYVWSSFALAFVVLFALLIEPIITRRSLFKQLEKRSAREQRIKAAEELEHRL